MATRPVNKKLLEIAQDEDRACVDRGEAIIELGRSGMRQKEIAKSTGFSEVAISHLKTCFLNLKGEARETCKAGKMNGDACYSLASALKKSLHPDSDRERIFRRAIELCRRRDTQPVQHMRPKGRQSPPGQITDKEMKMAIKDVDGSDGNG
jgi:hypothetical protein